MGFEMCSNPTMPYTREELRWNGWGLRRQTFDLRGHADDVWAFLAETLGVPSLPHTPAVALDDADLPASKLDPEVLGALQAATAKERVHTSALERAAHACGRSYPDLLRLRAGQLSTAPDAVVYPESHAECQTVLERCAAAGVAVVPFGGGSSVVGGVEGLAGEKPAVVTLDTTRMHRRLELDAVSHTATFEAGIWGPDLEAALQAEGWTLGHYPQSFEFSTLGGWIAARGAGQQSNRYGAANKWLVAARLATPEGELRTQPYPQSAAGPDLNEVVAGSEGLLGVITEATFKIHRVPESRDYRAYLFKNFEAGAKAIREIVQAGISVAMMRLSDADETYFFGTFKGLIKPPGAVERNAEKLLDKAGFGRGRCVLMIGLEGDRTEVRHALGRTLYVATRCGGLPVGTGPGHAWYEQRFAMPYLRDPMMDRGIAIDTLETSTEWSNIPRLYAAVRAAIREALGPRCGVLTHISHSYADGASLYFTFLFGRDLDDPMAQWVAVKRAASQAIADHGGTISHHHGVGKDHQEWFAGEKGPLGCALLSGAKAKLDPKGILNPGKMLG